MRLPLYQIDAFAEVPFSGNPAAVCPLESWLPDQLMQAIALENNLSETAFFCAAEGDLTEPGASRFDLRWFTPTLEVELCGHATLASAFVVFGLLVPEAESVEFSTRSGVLTVRRSGGGMLTMDFPALPPGDTMIPADDQVAAIGKSPEACYAVREVHGAPYQLWVFRTQEEVEDLAPIFADLAANVIATAPAELESSLDFVSRFFAPLSGVDEDPVTGSAHCTLTPYWAGRLAKAQLAARQVSARGGGVLCELVDDRVRLSGHCTLFLEGSITIPDVQ